MRLSVDALNRPEAAASSGNGRELDSCVERAVARADSGTVELDLLHVLPGQVPDASRWLSVRAHPSLCRAQLVARILSDAGSDRAELAKPHELSRSPLCALIPAFRFDGKAS